MNLYCVIFVFYFIVAATEQLKAPKVFKSSHKNGSSLVAFSNSIPHTSNKNGSNLAAFSKSIPHTSDKSGSNLTAPSNSIPHTDDENRSNLAAPSNSIPHTSHKKDSNLAAHSNFIPYTSDKNGSNLAAPSNSMPHTPDETGSNLAAPSYSIPHTSHKKDSNLAEPSNSIPHTSHKKDSNLAEPSNFIPHTSDENESNLAAPSNPIPHTSDENGSNFAAPSNSTPHTSDKNGSNLAAFSNSTPHTSDENGSNLAAFSNSIPHTSDKSGSNLAAPSNSIPHTDDENGSNLAASSNSIPHTSEKSGTNLAAPSNSTPHTSDENGSNLAASSDSIPHTDDKNGSNLAAPSSSISHRHLHPKLTKAQPSLKSRRLQLSKTKPHPTPNILQQKPGSLLSKVIASTRLSPPHTVTNKPAVPQAKTLEPANLLVTAPVTLPDTTTAIPYWKAKSKPQSASSVATLHKHPTSSRRNYAPTLLEKPPHPCAPFKRPPMPDFRAPGRRISEVKCYDYIWDLKVRNDEAEHENECTAFRSRGGISNYIIGGYFPYLGDYPNMGAIGWKAVVGTWKFMCGSTLISHKFVLTAAHCSSASELDSTIADVVPKIVRLGDTNIQDVVNGTNDATIIRIINHPKYKSPKKYFDIALMELGEVVKFTRDIQPACLWTKDSITKYGHKAQVTGWGVVESGSVKTSPELKAANVDIIDFSKCNKLLHMSCNRNWCGLQPDQLCAGKLSGGVDACQGDSGGPLQVKIPLPIGSEGTMHYVLGVTSFGVGCAIPGLPGVYTKVSSFIDWIESIVWPGQNGTAPFNVDGPDLERFERSIIY